MREICIVLTVASAFITAGALQLPKYVKPCGRNDPNFNECVIKHARETLKAPILEKGDPKYKLPSISPLLITEIKVVNTNGINLIIRDIKLHGLLGVSVDKLEFDFEKKRVFGEFRFPVLEIIGKYKMSGRLLLLPINGEGDLNITLVDSKMSVEGDFVQEIVGETQHAVVNNPRATMDPSRMYVLLTNLFNGDKVLGKQMNEFLNDKWKDAYNSLSAPIVEGIVQAVISVINEASSVVPFEEAFPESLP
ncbi:protein takeout-like [Zootermopsis nevadensis]|uniref:Protein takeout n=1 Tax=Zootermopsis nevadensis TaxID=136037 RepID=A0A067RNC0_ZOONE|nr:protein takeout-like [Zootermopsis nevadensis]KDR22095.1 Protein takeout [Zootermopsis nevadensis]